MRSVIADIASSAYRPGDAALLFGPNADGTLNSTTPEAFGTATVMPFEVEAGFGEEAFGLAAFAAAREYGGFGLERFGLDPFAQPTPRARMISRPQEFGVFQHAVQIQSKGGILSTLGTAAGVLVNSGPSKPVRTEIAVASSIVTLTITDPA